MLAALVVSHRSNKKMTTAARLRVRAVCRVLVEGRRKDLGRCSSAAARLGEQLLGVLTMTPNSFLQLGGGHILGLFFSEH